MPVGPGLDSALLVWINSFHLPTPARSWEDLQDGKIFWVMLTRICPSFFTGSLPESAPSENWIRKWQNLKHVNRLVTAFIRDECGRMMTWTGRLNVDLKAIAIDKSIPETIKLAEIILLAAVYSPEFNKQLISTMETLGPQVSKPIALCVESMITQDAQSYDIPLELDYRGSSRSISPSESGLEQEEQTIGELKQSADIRDGKNHLAENLRGPHRVIAESEEQPDASIREDTESSRRKTDEHVVKHLQERMQDDIELIATLETDLLSTKAIVTNQSRKLEMLSKDNDRNQLLLDQLETLQAERDALLQKVQAAESTREQFRLVQTSENTIGMLRAQYEDALNQLNSLNHLKERNDDLERKYLSSLHEIQSREQALLVQIASRERLEEYVRKLTQSLETPSRASQETTNILETSSLESRQENVLEAFGILGDEIEATESVRDQETVLKAFGSLGDEIEAIESVKYTLMAENNRLNAEIARLQAMQSRKSDSALREDRESVDSDESNPSSARLERNLRRSISERASHTNDTILQLIQEGRNALMHTDDQAEEQPESDQTIEEDRSHLHSSGKTGLSPEVKHREILYRELRLMSSAWYNVTRRMQSDAVVVQRRQQVPRSFLNKQRKLLRDPEPGIQ